jgi:hypothetical protein
MSSESRKVAEGRSATMARLILFTCPQCEDDVRREPASENGSIQTWCRCGEHTFPAGNLLPETPNEWEFVITRVSSGIRDAQAECEARVKRLMVSDHVRRYRDKFAKEGAKV